MASQHNAASKSQKLILAAIAAGSVLTMASTATAATLKVTIENLAPQNGNFLTPLWVGFHNGNFDTFTEGASTSGLPFERLVEDGLTQPISNQFSSSTAGVVQGTIFGGPARPIAPISPEQSASLTFNVDGSLESSRYFSYAAMVIPSNDAFIGNDDPREHRLFDDAGNFIQTSFDVLGSEVYDAGTEVNDETSMNTAFLGQAAPNTGIDENGVVKLHPGFRPKGTGGILDNPRFANADFKASGYRVARITIESVPEPSTAVLLPLAGLFLLYHRVRRLLSKES